jgi:branched-chain amino acid transport system substrate-binding protein
MKASTKAPRPFARKSARLAMASLFLGLLAVVMPGLASGQERELKIGIIGPFSGPAAGAAQQVLDGLMLGIDSAGGKLAGLKTTVIREDDQLKPDVGLQAANKLIEREKVDVIIGPHYSNVMVAAYRTMVDNKVLIISAVSGPSLIAGKQCSPYFFAASFQNDEAHEVLGLHLQEKGFKRAYLMAPNYPAGKDSLNGFKRTFKAGEIVGEVYTGLSQLDFAAEIAQIKSANPDVVAVFYPSTFGINFHKQYGQSGLLKEIPLYSAFSLDETSLAAVGDLAIGTFQVATWNPDSPGEANQKFVEDFVKRYAYRPTFISAYAYDAPRLLNAALTEVKGNLADKPALIAAIEKASFTSVRGKFKFNTNHFPIQDYNLLEVVKTSDGKLIQVTRATIRRDYSNAYVADCKMPNP